ncbi:uncharacterized protein LOC121601271 [Anopheles merus]|uniref:uncharacterized protein LOC121601271 n=1 Tax=Anopheles merus TaxID=30066 RepID=UPI001BE479A2|nr:uncharacterized protein LOC121601271 [Anopheles merus]
MENKRFWNSQIWTVFTLFLAEFFGTAMLLFGGCMAGIDGFDNVTSNISRGITFGMVVMMAFITFSATSGAIINPVVSLAAYIYGTLSLQLTLLYCGSIRRGTMWLRTIKSSHTVAILPTSAGARKRPLRYSPSSKPIFWNGPCSGDITNGHVSVDELWRLGSAQ